MGGIRGAGVEQNPNYVAPDPWAAGRDEEGNVTLEAWQSMFPIDMAAGVRDAPGPWSTAVILPLGRQLQVLEAWYGHPSDPACRVDIKERVRKLLEGPTYLPGGVAVSNKFVKDGQLCLPADTES